MINFLEQSAGWTFVASFFFYVVLVGFACWRYSKSGHADAHKNFPKIVKHITKGFVSVVIFMLLFYLAITGLIPTNVIIALVSVFATAGFLTFKDK